MSKNTGTSELINYFDLGVNGDVGIAGSLDINTIANATTDTDTFLVSDTGIIKYRTGAQLLSDIGAAPAVAGGYVPYTGATTNVDLGVYNLTASAIIANGSGSNSGIVHLESNAIHSLVNGYGSIASGTTNQFNLYQTTGAGVFRGAILSLNSITEFATRTFTLPDTDGTIALTSQIPANAVGGTGTTNYLPKFTGSTTIGNSQVIDNGTQVGIGLTPNASYGTLQIKSPSSTYCLDLIGRTAGLNSESIITFWNAAQSGALAQILNIGPNLYLSTGGNNPFFLSSTGNFIFGSYSDNGARLQVNGNANFSFAPTLGGYQVQALSNSGGSTSYGGVVVQSVNGKAGYLTCGDNSTTTWYGAQASFVSLGATLGAGIKLRVNADDTKGITIPTSGNVGIGTASPVNILSVFQNNASSAATLELTNTSTGANITKSSRVLFVLSDTVGTLKESAYIESLPTNDANVVNADLRFGTRGSDAFPTERMRITSSGSVLIGTTTDIGGTLQVAAPALISVFQSTTSTLFNGLEMRNGGGSFYFGQDNSSGTFYGSGTAYAGSLYVSGAHPLVMFTSGTERMRITSGGYLKASNDGTYVAVGGNFHEFTASANGSDALLVRHKGTDPYGSEVMFTGASPNNTSNWFFYASDSTNSKFIVYSNGNVVNRNNSYGAISDVKLKENIEDATPKLEDLMKVKVRNYNLIGDDKKQIGVIAQELKEVFPAMIEETPDKDKDGNNLGTTTKSVKYSVFVPMLIKAIQEQQEQIQELKNKLL